MALTLNSGNLNETMEAIGAAGPNGEHAWPLARLQRDFGRMAKIKPFHTATSIAATRQSRHMSLNLGSQTAKSIRPRFINSSNDPKVMKGSLIVSAVAGDGLFNADFAAGQKLFTVNGAVPGATPGETEEGYGQLICDVIKINVAGFLAWRTQCEAAFGSRFAIGSGATSNNLTANGFLSCRRFNSDWVGDPTSPNAGTATFEDSAPPVIFDLYGTNNTRNIGTFGASTFANKESTNTLGLFPHVGNLLTTASQCASFECYSVSGRRTAESLEAFKAELLRGVQLHDALFPICTTNDEFDSDWGLPGYLTRVALQCSEFIRLCRIYGIRPWLATSQIRTGLANTGVNGKAEYTTMKAANQIGRNVALREILLVSGYGGVIEIEQAVNDTSASTGTWLNPAETTDGLHINDTGRVRVAPLIAADMAV